jgi:hypothetical protein
MGARAMPGTLMRRDRGSSIGPPATAHLVEAENARKRENGVAISIIASYACRHSCPTHRLYSLIEDHDFNFFRSPRRHRPLRPAL